MCPECFFLMLFFCGYRACYCSSSFSSSSSSSSSSFRSSPAYGFSGRPPGGAGCRERSQRSCLRPGGLPSLTRNPGLQRPFRSRRGLRSRHPGNGNLDEVHEGLLLQAVRASWLAKENRARIDDVVDFLKNASDSEQYAESPTIRSRLDEMIVLLDQYTANGTYGQYFNSDEPSLRDDAKMVVLELGGLEDRPSLLVAVMFSLIIYIENRMYRTPRNLKKLNVIDEGWRLLDFKNHKVGEFIEKGYRTARRHTGAYITITQNIVDFDSDKASSAARAAWGNSSYKIILKQSAKEFAKYNQLYPDQFLPLQRDMIGKFGAAKDQWFSSFLLQVENHSSWHRLFVDPLSRAMYSSDGPDFEFVQQKRKEGLSIHEAVWQLAWKKSGPEMASLEAWLEEHEKYRSVA